MVPLVSDVAAIAEPENEKEIPVEHTSTAEEAPDVSTSGPETAYAIAIEGTPANVDHNLLAESGSHDDEKNDSKTSYSAPILAAAEQLPEVASQEITQPQSTEVLVVEDAQDDREIIASSTELEGHVTAEHIEAKKDFVQEVGFTRFSQTVSFF